jgi:hypothetical protein
MIERIGILNIPRLTAAADSQVKLVVVRNVLQQIPRPFETQMRIFMQQQIRLVSTTNAVAEFDIRPRPARRYIVTRVDAQQKTTAKQCHQGRGLQLIVRIFDKAANLPR